MLVGGSSRAREIRIKGGIKCGQFVASSCYNFLLQVEFVPANRRGRYYGFFYTTNEIGTVAAPIAYGIIADALSLNATMLIMGCVTALILPASLLLLTRRFG